MDTTFEELMTKANNICKDTKYQKGLLGVDVAQVYALMAIANRLDMLCKVQEKK